MGLSVIDIKSEALGAGILVWALALASCTVDTFEACAPEEQSRLVSMARFPEKKLDVPDSASRCMKSTSCRILPPSSAWNTDISSYPVHPLSDAIIGKIGPSGNMHPDFGSGTYDGKPIGIPYDLVPEGLEKVATTESFILNRHWISHPKLSKRSNAGVVFTFTNIPLFIP